MWMFFFLNIVKMPQQFAAKCVDCDGVQNARAVSREPLAVSTAATRYWRTSWRGPLLVSCARPTTRTPTCLWLAAWTSTGASVRGFQHSLVTARVDLSPILILGCWRLHPPSPFSTTQPENGHSFYFLTKRIYKRDQACDQDLYLWGLSVLSPALPFPSALFPSSPFLPTAPLLSIPLIQFEDLVECRSRRNPADKRFSANFQLKTKHLTMIQIFLAMTYFWPLLKSSKFD